MFREVTIGDCRLINADCMEALKDVECHAIITDPPYSGRTHAGHDTSANGHDGEGNDLANRKTLGYSPWSFVEVSEFMSLAAKACAGWICCMTDHTLARSWAEEMEKHNRYVFAPLPYYAPGSRVRLSGDGPSSWTDWIIVCRTVKQHKWGTLPGGYLGFAYRD